MPEQPILKDIRILDFSWVLAGPYATRLLADFGAEVIKVQPLAPEAADRFSRGYYSTWNRNKLGITLNLSKTEGIEIAKALVKLSDAVVENFSPRVMENWGLGYPQLEQLKPDIIMLSLSAMGHSGPWKDYTGFGPTVQAFSGITNLTSYPGEPPGGIGYSYADHVSGLYGSLALLGALEYRRQTGKGQYIDLSQTEAMTSLLADPVLDYTHTGIEPAPPGLLNDVGNVHRHARLLQGPGDDVAGFVDVEILRAPAMDVVEVAGRLDVPRPGGVGRIAHLVCFKSNAL
jgi:crotonobetainyl-CoA:carnitine CoA-transferase CaiB-like acyl-CoA transferase